MLARAGNRIWLSLVAGFTGVLVGALGLPVVPAASASTSANPITYVYDDIGRLEAAIDPTQANGLATYVYDAVGNLTQITRSAISTTPQIVDFHPHKVPVGNPITIYGTGFSSTASQNVVTFTGGATATATASTQSTATVTVPASAQTGSIKIMNTETNETSSLSTQSWSPPVATPQITQLNGSSSNIVAHPGDTITVAGSGFASNPADDLVRINATVAVVTSATSTQLTIKVPSFDVSTYGAPTFIGPGPVTVATATGSATSPNDVLLPLSNYDSTAFSAVRFGTNETRTINFSAGQSTIVALFTGTAGRYVFTKRTTSEGISDYHLYDPLGSKATTSQDNSAVWLDYSGTYALLIKRSNPAAAGTVTLEIEESDSVDAGTVNVSTSQTVVRIPRTFPGQWGLFRFQGTAGHNYCMVTDNNLGINLHAYRPTHPDGEANFGDTYVNVNHDVLVAAPETGTYTVLAAGYKTTTDLVIGITDLGGGTSCTGSPAAAMGAAVDSPAVSMASGTSPDPLAAAADYDSPYPPTWSPTAATSAEWIANRAPSPWEDVPLLAASAGTTAIAGRVLALNGEPIRGVTIAAGVASTSTDASGRFVLGGVSPGRVVMTVDARGAGLPGRNVAFGVFEIGVDAIKGQTTNLGYTIWEPALDVATKVHIDSYPLPKDFVIQNPKMPGFEVHIPKGSTIVDSQGKMVHDITLTPVPLDRPPFPAPEMNQFTMHFTLQPGDATVEPNGFRVVYANNQHLPPGFTGRVWTYEPDEGWDNYGTATVTPDGSQVVPEAGAYIDGFQGASMTAEMLALVDPLCHVPFLGHLCSSDPVDYGNGLFEYKMIDLVEPGTPSISLTRFFRQNDATTYSLGLGMAASYDLRLNSTNASNYANLAIPGNERVTFQPMNGPGTGVPMVAVSGPPEWLGAELTRGSVYRVRRRDGMRYQFGGNGSGSTWLTEITDPSRNRIIISRTFPGKLVSILAEPSGRWITFARSSCCNGSVLSSASDSAGRTVTYTYQTTAPYRLLTVTDPSQQGQQSPAQTTYGWNPDTSFCSQSAPCSPSPATYLFDIHDRLGNHTIHLDYDAQGRIAQQTFANAATQTFDYDSTDPLCTGSTKAVDPDGNATCARFDANGIPTSVTEALGTPLERTFTYALDTTSKNVTSTTDSFEVSGVTHTRQTTFTYDGVGNISQVSSWPTPAHRRPGPSRTTPGMRA